MPLLSPSNQTAGESGKLVGVIGFGRHWLVVLRNGIG
jgi:hypothetical protein